MYNFYQSGLRKDINNNVFHKPTGEIKLFWIVYQYIIRKKNIWPIYLSRVQILWITGIENHSFKEWQHELKQLIATEKPIFIQLWSIDTIAVSTPIEYRDDSHWKGILAIGQKITSDIVWAWFHKATKENLPPSSYSIRTTNTIENLLENCNKQTQTKIHKAQKKWIIIKQASLGERKDFMDILSQTATKKWFNVISETTLHTLLDYKNPDTVAQLYVAVFEDNVIAWAVYLIDKQKKTAIYLYGWTDRNYLNIWASHLLHRETRQLLAHQWCEHVDLLWGHPTWDNSHHLAWVWQFKEWFGWIKYDYVWSFDIICNVYLYRLWSFLRRL